MRAMLVSAALLLCLSAMPAVADDDTGEGAAPVPAKVADAYVDMEDFLRSVAKATGMPLVWNPADKNIRGKRIIGNVDLTMPRDELFSYARSLLTFYELIIIPVGPRGHQVHLVMDARQTSAILRIKPEPVALTDENVADFEDDDGRFLTTTIHVQHLDDLRSARNALTRIISGQNVGTVTEVPTARAFIITDFAPNVAACYRLIREMDVPQAKPSTASGRTVAITLQHATAAELAETLVRHYAAPPQAPRAPQVPGTEPPTAPRITPDARTNKILVTGDDAEIEAVKAAIALLDTPLPAPKDTPRVSAVVVPLKNVRAQETAAILLNLMRGAPAMWSGGDARPWVMAHADNALLVAATDADLAKVRALIAELEAR